MSEVLRYPCTIIRVEERWNQQYESGSGDKTIFKSVSTGWWIVLNLGISLPCGLSKPSFNPGDHIRLSVEKHP